MAKSVEKRVLVAMSGGVDSAVSALLLKKQGFDVCGVHFRFWQEKGFAKGKEAQTKKVSLLAKIIAIPFFELNLEKEFKKNIVDKFLKWQEQGITPNPCVFCNKEMKFCFLAKKAKELGFDFIATGHYAKIRFDRKTGKYRLFAAPDKTKDQSYFLWKLGQEELKKIIFPVSPYKKTEVKKVAEKAGFPLYDMKESQEICFIKSKTSQFLEKYLKPKPGNIADKTGKVLGKHSGLYFYTIGQRKGINLPLGPYYVIEKDFKKNILRVSKDKKDLFKKRLEAFDVNWVSGKEPRFPLEVQAKIRYRHRKNKCKVEKINKNKVKVLFAKPQTAATPGQSIVFYKGNEVLGGGIIK